MRGLIWLLAAALAAAQEADAAARFLAALHGAPEARAARLAAHAAVWRTAAAGAWPEPQLELEGGRARQDGGGAMYGVRLEQMLPRWGAPQAERRRARAAALEAEAEASERLGALAEALAVALAERGAAQAALAVLADAERRLHALAAGLDARAGAGEGQAAALRAAQRQARLEDERDRERQRLADAEARARAILALGPEAALPPYAAPDPDAIEPARSPEARRAAAQAEAARAEADAALAGGRPEVALALGWQREGAGTDMAEDRVLLAVRLALPVRRAALAAERGAAERVLAAAELGPAAARARAEAELASQRRAIARAAAAGERARVLAQRAAAWWSAQQARLAGGAATPEDALEAWELLLDAERAAIAAEEEAARARAALWRLAPPPLEPEASR